jgi:hypothetical protein
MGVAATGSAATGAAVSETAATGAAVSETAATGAAATGAAATGAAARVCKVLRVLLKKNKKRLKCLTLLGMGGGGCLKYFCLYC